MKIHYLAFIRLPTEKAHGAQIMKTCEAFANTGVEVELIIPGRKTPIGEDAFTYYGVKKNFRITSLNAPDWVGQLYVFGFGFSMLWFSEIAKWRKSFWKADIVYSRDAFVLLQYFFLTKKLVYEAHTKPTLVSLFVAKRVFRLVVISEGLRDAYISAGIVPEKIIVAHDAIDPEPFQKQYEKKESRAWLNIPQEKKIALYVGKIDLAKGADTFAAVSDYVSSEWLCVLIGPDSALKEQLKKKFPKALFLPETPYRDLPRVLATADVLILPNSAKDENASHFTSPLKAFAYLASGKPIVASDVPALRSILRDDAHYVNPDDVKILTEIIQNQKILTIFPPFKSFSWANRADNIIRALL